MFPDNVPLLLSFCVWMNDCSQFDFIRFGSRSDPVSALLVPPISISCCLFSLLLIQFRFLVSQFLLCSSSSPYVSSAALPSFCFWHFCSKNELQVQILSILFPLFDFDLMVCQSPFVWIQKQQFSTCFAKIILMTGIGTSVKEEIHISNREILISNGIQFEIKFRTDHWHNLNGWPSLSLELISVTWCGRSDKVVEDDGWWFWNETKSRYHTQDHVEHLISDCRSRSVKLEEIWVRSYHTDAVPIRQDERMETDVWKFLCVCASGNCECHHGACFPKFQCPLGGESCTNDSEALIRAIENHVLKESRKRDNANK